MNEGREYDDLRKFPCVSNIKGDHGVANYRQRLHRNKRTMI